MQTSWLCRHHGPRLRPSAAAAKHGERCTAERFQITQNASMQITQNKLGNSNVCNEMGGRVCRGYLAVARLCRMSDRLRGAPPSDCVGA